MPFISYNLAVYYPVHKEQLDTILSQLNPIHNPSNEFLNIYCIITFSFLLKSLKWNLPFSYFFFNFNFIGLIIYARHAL